MRLALIGVLLLLAAPAMADDKDRLVGTWRLVSWIAENVDTKERKLDYGEQPNGYMIFTREGRWMMVLTAQDRKMPKSDEDRAAAFRSMVAYSGKYRVDDNKFIAVPDVAWNQALIGKEQIRFFRTEGDKLQTESAPIPDLNAGGMIRSIQTFERERY
jgi:hypothetical protein